MDAEERSTIRILCIFTVFVIMLCGTVALAAPCQTPPAAFFANDSVMTGNAPHEGMQLTYNWWIPEAKADQYFRGADNFLHITDYALGKSHNEQEKIMFGLKYYCASIPDYYPIFPAV